jgi:hypothetical protein
MDNEVINEVIENFRAAISSANKEVMRNAIWQLSDHDLNEMELIQIAGKLQSIVEIYTGIFQFEIKNKIITHKDYEGMIWEIGEKFRQIIKEKKKLKTNEKLFKEIEKVALNKLYGKGRESFVMLLGQYGGKAYIPTLVELLNDEVVSGHAVYALRLLKAKEAAEYVRPFLDSKVTWVRNEAKSYFKFMEKV